MSRPVQLGWRGPLPRPRVTPPATLGMFLPSSPAGAECGEAAISDQQVAPIADRDRDIVVDVVQFQVPTMSSGPRLHDDPGRTSPWAYLERRFAAL